MSEPSNAVALRMSVVMNRRRATIASLGLLALVAALAVPPAWAGCGCEKPPPPPAAVRPSVAYSGAALTLFGPSLQTGHSYTVTFSSGTTQATASVTSTVVSRRDLADGVVRPQLVLQVPALPLGPTRIAVTDPTSGTSVLTADDASFTVAPQPVAIPGDYGKYRWPGFQAAVGRDGVVYIALDLTAVSTPIVFEAQAFGYPLRFSSDDVVFENIQGFLMQLLVQNSTSGVEPIPGMFVFPAENAAQDSDALHYSRHEFATYFLQHQERQPHALDPTDPNWHVDGSRHVDHNHLILAIMGHMPDGSLPAPGATPAFDLSAANYSLFYQGLVGESSVTMTASTTIDSYTPGTSGFGSDGDVFTNGTLSISKKARIAGDATAASFDVSDNAQITGQQIPLREPATFMDIKVPTLLPDLGAIDLNGGGQTIVGPGSFLVSAMRLNKAALYVDNTAGPVTLYVTGPVEFRGGSTITLADPDPERFAVYLAGTSPVNLTGVDSTFHGVIYAPYSPLTITNNGEFFGAFVADRLRLGKSAAVHYWSALRGE